VTKWIEIDIFFFFLLLIHALGELVLAISLCLHAIYILYNNRKINLRLFPKPLHLNQRVMYTIWSTLHILLNIPVIKLSTLPRIFIVIIFGKEFLHLHFLFSHFLIVIQIKPSIRNMCHIFYTSTSKYYYIRLQNYLISNFFQLFITYLFLTLSLKISLYKS